MGNIKIEKEFENWLEITAENLKNFGRIDEGIVYLEILIKFREMFRINNSFPHCKTVIIKADNSKSS